MRCITLTQPWATLVAIGAKLVETRSWGTDYRGPLAIHAAKGVGPVGGLSGLHNLCLEEPFRSVLETWSQKFNVGYSALMPRGAIIATCNLTNVVRIPTTPRHFPRGVANGHPLASYPMVIPPHQPPFQDSNEYFFGDYTPGRYAWLLHDVVMLPEPVPAKGQLGLWEWEP